MSLLNKQIPDFVLTTQEGEKFTSADMLKKGGKHVILFFPLAFSSVCTAELCSMRDNLSSYQNLDANIYGVSIDSFFTLREFAKSQNLNFPLLSDFNKEVSQSFGTFYEDFLGMKGISKRSAFVIDQEGVIKYEEINDDAAKIPDFEAIANKLKEI
jgi:peroxiredoxin